MAQTNPEMTVLWGVAFDKIPEQHACAQDLYAFAATFVVAYVIPPGRVNAGEHYKQDVAEGMWSALFQITKRRFEKSERPETKVRSPLPSAVAARSERSALLLCCC